MGLLRSVFSPSPSSSRRRSQLNPASVQGTEGKFLCFRGCFGGGCHAEAPREIASRENKAMQNKSLAIVRRLLKRKSKSGSTNLFLVHEKSNAHEARVPAASDQDTAASIGSVDTSIDALEFLTLAKSRDMDTDKKSPPSSSSTESRTIIARADREGNQECIVSPVLLSFRFNIPGYDGASMPETLLFHDELDCISLANTCGTITCNGNKGSCESMISPILNSSSLTSGSDAGFRTPGVLSFHDELDCISLADTCGTNTCNGNEGSCESMISPILNSSSLTSGSDAGFRTPDVLSFHDELDCISLADTCGTITCNGNEGSCESMISPILNSSSLTSGSDASFRTPDILLGIGTLEEGTGYPLDSGSSAETRSSFTSRDDELNCKLIGSDACFRTADLLSGISTLEEGTGYPPDSGSSAESRSSFTSSEDELNCKLIGSDNGFRTLDILSGISTLEEGTGYPLDSGSLAETQSAFTSTNDELNRKMMFQVTLEMLMEMESLLPTDRYDREVEGEFGVSDCVSSSVSRSPFVCWSNQQSRNTVQPSSGSPIFAQPDVLFPPSPRPLSLPSNSSITSTDRAEDHEMMVVLEMLMEMENLVPSDTYDSEAETDFEVRDRVHGSISSSPLVCWSNRQGRMTVEPSFGCALFEHPDTLFPPSPGAPCSPPCSSVTSIHGALDHETKVTLEMLMEMENLYLGDTYDEEVEGEFGVGGCVSSSVSRSPFVCWSNQQSRITVEPSSGSPLFALPNAVFPPSPRTPTSPSPHSPSSVCIGSSSSEDGGAEEILIVPVQGSGDTNGHQWTIASTSESGIWESRATAEMLMKLQNLLSEETTGLGVEIRFGFRDHLPRSVGSSPLVCWSQ